MRLQRPLSLISLRDKVVSIEARKQSGTEIMEQEIQKYHSNWHNHVERIPPVCLPQQAYSF